MKNSFKAPAKPLFMLVIYDMSEYMIKAETFNNKADFLKAYQQDINIGNEIQFAGMFSPLDIVPVEVVTKFEIKNN